MSHSKWHLTVLGSIDLRGGDPEAAESVLVQPKHVALLAFLELESLTVHQRRFARRDHIVGLLWPELDQAHARTALRRVVHQIRTALGADLLVSRGDEELALAAPMPATVAAIHVVNIVSLSCLSKMLLASETLDREATGVWHGSNTAIFVYGKNQRHRDVIGILTESFAGSGGARTYADGVDIGGEGPEEVAWAMVAEIMAVRNKRNAGFLRDRKGPIHERQKPEEPASISAS